MLLENLAGFFVALDPTMDTHNGLAALDTVDVDAYCHFTSC